MSQKYKLTALATLTLIAAASGCNGNSSSQSTTSFVKFISDGTGTNYTFVKNSSPNGYGCVAGATHCSTTIFANTRVDNYTNYAVLKDSSGNYAIFNQALYKSGESYQDYVKSAGIYDIFKNVTANQMGWTTDPATGESYYNSNLFYNVTSSDGISMMFFSTARTYSKDLESVIAKSAKTDANLMGIALVNQYGFSQERALKVATLTKQLQEVSGTRELTYADKDLFVQQSLGVNYESLKAALKDSNRGQEASFNALVQQAASSNGITPEQAKNLILDVQNQ